MRKIIFKKSGRIMNVENNVAFGFIDRGLAVLFKGANMEEKGLDEPQKDKMMKRTNKKDKIRIK